MRLADRLTDFMERQKNVGVAGCAMIVRHQGKEVYHHMTGHADMENGRFVDEKTLFRMHSMTKVITVTAALQLFERGLFLLSDPVSEYLPELKDLYVWDTNSGRENRMVPAKNPIRIVDLFAMTAGFSYPGEDSEPAKKTAEIFAALDEKFPGQTYTIRSVVQKLSGAPLAFEPGTHWRYSLCHDVLGALIEVVAGKTLGQYFSESIFEPLDMRDTAFRLRDGDERRLSKFYTVDELGNRKEIKEKDAGYQQGALYESGGSGLLSTPADYMKFADVLSHGGTSADGIRLLGGKTVELMRKNQLSEEMLKDFNWPFLRGYGYGLGVRTLMDIAKSGCSGNIGEFGWCGYGGTYVMMDPVERLSVVYCHQMQPNREEYLQPRIKAILYGNI